VIDAPFLGWVTAHDCEIALAHELHRKAGFMPVEHSAMDK
jgi:hypothetical protein